MADCSVCADIDRTERGEHPWAVARLPTGYVWMHPTQYFEGATLFVATQCVRELHDLPTDGRAAHLLEMSEVAAAVHHGFGADKMNYEALGNRSAHLHWWLTPRRRTDGRPGAPIWEDLDFLRILWSEDDTTDDDRRSDLKNRLLSALRQRPVEIERSFVR
jgi:diadenosine tetraphosphate (Ap4A) HIT family hydrolase